MKDITINYLQFLNDNIGQIIYGNTKYNNGVIIKCKIHALELFNEVQADHRAFRKELTDYQERFIFKDKIPEYKRPILLLTETPF